MTLTTIVPAGLPKVLERGDLAQAELFMRIARLERLFVLATMGGKDALAETNKILQQLIKDAAG